MHGLQIGWVVSAWSPDRVGGEWHWPSWGWVGEGGMDSRWGTLVWVWVVSRGGAMVGGAEWVGRVVSFNIRHAH